MFLHNVRKATWESLRENTNRTLNYVRAAIDLLGSDQVEDEDDKKMVIDRLGYPPSPSRPIYIITTKESTNESIFYVGKTTAANRFSGGHSVALELTDPKYNNCEKLVYRCSVTIPVGDDHVALEWIDPVHVAERILNDVESRLIYEFKPPLNYQKKKRNLANHQAGIHIQNDVEGLKPNSFLNDYIF
ncbi:MAG TPA: hypothetical protein VJM08_11505 [Anaerolineales bacterium]|nr:hypothetical protein [Anaerolineales bacterium]